MAEASQGSGSTSGATKTFATAVLRWFDAIPDWAIAIVARIGIFGVFWRSARLKVDGFLDITQSTFFMFQNEYQVPLLPYKLAAQLTTVSEHLFSALIIIGLATRLSATALLIMTLVIQIFIYPVAWPTHFTWMAALVYLMARGPGALSIDHFVRKAYSKS